MAAIQCYLPCACAQCTHGAEEFPAQPSRSEASFLLTRNRSWRKILDGGVSQIFSEFSSRKLGKWSNLTVAYFSDGLVQPPTRIAASKKIPLNKLTAIPLWSKLTQPTNTGNRWFFQIFFGGGSGLFVLVAHQKTWTCDLSSLMWFPKTTLSWTFHDWWWFSPTSWLKTSIFFSTTRQRNNAGQSQLSALEEPFWSLFWKR